MSLPDNLSMKELLDNGFVVDVNDDQHAKHKAFRSYRHRCVKCSRWVKQRNTHRLCTKCALKH